MMFLDCPAYLDQHGAARCGLPAEVLCRYTMSSTDGLLESARIRCPAGHWFNGPIEFLVLNRRPQQQPGTATAAFITTHGKLTTGRDDPAGSGGLAAGEPAGQPGRDTPRPHGAPTYYMGRPARLWITALRRRRGHTTSYHLIEAVTGG